jgi:hypothetical protein
MIGLIFMSLAAQPPERVTITVYGRESVGLDERKDVITGLCDGVPSSVIITKESRRPGRAAPGMIEMRHGDSSIEVPASFARGVLVRNSVHGTGLGCDGKRLKLWVYAVQAKDETGLRYFSQTATWNFGTNDLEVTDPVDENAEEFAAHMLPVH